MKKFLALALLSSITFVSAQTKFTKGTKIIEVGSTTLENRYIPTGIGVYFADGGETSVSVGVSGGYFLTDNFAVKVGLGYAHTSTKGVTQINSYGYSIGAEGYIEGIVPIGVTYAGAVNKGKQQNASYMQFHAGYAFTIGNHFVITPMVRYDKSLNDYHKSGLGVGIKAGYKF